MKQYLLPCVMIIALIFGLQTLKAQQVQAIHAIGDPALDTIDVYISIPVIGVLSTLEDVPFRFGSPFADVSLIQGIPTSFGIAPGNSTGVGDTLVNFIVVFASGQNYVGVVRGVIDPNQFLPNPEGRTTTLDFTLNNNARLVSATPGQVEFSFMNMVTDAPAVDLRLLGGSTLASAVSYGDFTPYVTMTPGVYQLEVVENGTSNVLATFDADLSAFADSAMVLMLAGFVDPSQNQNGEPLGLRGVFPQGTNVDFPRSLVGLDDSQPGLSNGFALRQNYPNPFNPSTTIEFDLAASADVELAVYNVTGQKVAVLVHGQLNSGSHRYQWQAEDFPAGVYLYRLTTPGFTQTRKMLLVK